MKGQRNKLQGVHVLWAAVDRPKLLAEAHDDTCTHTMGCHTAGTYSIKISFPKSICRFYKIMKKKVLRLQSMNFVLRSCFIYQC